MSWLIIDHTKTLEREEILGFSLVEPKGKRKLEERPRCSFCRRQVWMHSVAWQEKYKFSGRRIGDASFELGVDFLVSNRFKTAWEDDGMKGITFSDSPLNTIAKSKSQFDSSKQEYFKVFPEPIFARFQDEAKVVYREEPSCSVCMSSEVVELKEVIFDTDFDLDCCLVSCLPGWTVVSDRFFSFIEKHGFTNFFLMKGFTRKEDRSLLRHTFMVPVNKGCYQIIDECDDSCLSKTLRDLGRVDKFRA